MVCDGAQELKMWVETENLEGDLIITPSMGETKYEDGEIKRQTISLSGLVDEDDNETDDYEVARGPSIIDNRSWFIKMVSDNGQVFRS